MADTLHGKKSSAFQEPLSAFNAYAKVTASLEAEINSIGDLWPDNDTASIRDVNAKLDATQVNLKCKPAKKPLPSKRLFAEEIEVVNSLFNTWTACERTVVIYALLKRMPYANLKFLQCSIESNLTQNVERHSSDLDAVMLDVNANNAKYLNDFIKKYAERLGDKEALLEEVLKMLPLLKPGNEESKKCFMTLVSLAIDDTEKNIVSIILVQQIMSYLLIHPALMSADRTTLLHYMHRLEQCNSGGLAQKPNATTTQPVEKLSWQTIAPPNKQQTQKLLRRQLHNDNGYLSSSGGSASSSCDGGQINLCDNFSAAKLRNGSPDTSDYNGIINGSDHKYAAGSANFIGKLLQSRLPKPTLSVSSSSDDGNQKTSNETHIFESDNAETPDVSNDADRDSIGSLNCTGSFKFLKPNQFASGFGSFKTRRSNSLTTQGTPMLAIKSSSVTNSSSGNENNSSTSIENLALFANKPRSFSLSTALQQQLQQQQQQPPAINVSASESHLSELKPGATKFQTRNVGMACIGQWLKLLRLHKYIELFQDMCYEDFLLVTEEALRSVGVTKGAAHKLANCIEGLTKRKETLMKIQEDLSNGQIEIGRALQELSVMALAPMKPIEVVRETDGEINVGKYFLQVLFKVADIFENDVYLSRNEDMISYLLWLLDRSMHHEAFYNHLGDLKALKLKFTEIKMALSQNDQNNKQNANGGQNKLRVDKTKWAGKGRKPDNKVSPNYRKNSNDMQHFQFQYGPQQPFNSIENIGLPNYNPNQYKSSSYPNFTSNQQQTNYGLLQHQQQQPPPPIHNFVQPLNGTQHERFNRQHQNYLQAPTQFPQQQQQQQQQQQRIGTLKQHPQSLTNLFFPTGAMQPYPISSAQDYANNTTNETSVKELANGINDENATKDDLPHVLKQTNGKKK